MEAYTQLMYQLFAWSSDREAANIADWVIEHITGFKRIDRIINKKFPLTEDQQKILQQYTTQLLLHKPVQYVLQEAWFAGIKLYVDENVLIPRPETEELVEWVAEEVSICQLPIAGLIDIGTGSGCIPIALKRKLPDVKIHAVDISAAAIDVAKKNATNLEMDIHFKQMDILEKEAWKQLPVFDIIVSNPPYIKQTEAFAMNENVLKYEPHTALFVPDNNALLFYETIAVFGLQHLTADGKLFFEINETLGKQVCSLLEKYGYTNIELRKDLQGKDRMVKAGKSKDSI